MKNQPDSPRQYPARLLSVGLALTLLITSCGAPAAPMATAVPRQAATLAPPTQAVSARGQGGILRLLYFQAPTIVNPHLSPGTKDLSASRITYEPLASFDKDSKLIPLLAAEVPSVENGQVAADGTSATWKLKKDVKWADGEPFTADDVLFTYQYILNPDVKSSSAGAYSEVESVEVLDDYTVKVNFKQPTAAWYAPFVGPFGMIIPRHIFEDYNGANFADAPENLQAIGTGPYFVSEYRKEDVLIIGGNAVSTVKIIYEINPYFRERDKPFFSKVELQGGGDLNLAGQASKEGTVDFAWNLALPEDTLVGIESAGKVRVLAAPSSFVERIMINFTDPNRETADGERSSLQFPHPFLSDLQVRRAISMAIDRETIAAPYGRGGKLTTNILVEPSFYASPNNAFEYNPQKAATLLEDAGWVDSNEDGVREKDGVELRLVFQTSIQPLRQAAQEQVKKDLEAIGFAVELKQIDASIFLGPPKDTTDTRRQFYADLEEFAFSNKSPDPAAYMAGWVCDQAAQKENDWSLPNWSRYCNPEFDALFNQAAAELDPDKRTELFVRMNELLIQDVAVIPLVNTTLPTAISVDLKGYDATPWDVEVWKIADWYK
ncbi:MAG TPA: peptide ABC transporter substrate-binding protein [Anaerolineales bacterium]|nr:peptide ABC transporter substrate-binding protein [Anaerolineales bacterium]